MGKTIFVVLDGCGDELARENMGYLEHMAEVGQAQRYTVEGELPSMSRPMYETLLTGRLAYEHGVINNGIVRASKCEHIFSLCRKQGLTTAAAAYGWVSELYNHAPFVLERDRFQFHTEEAIQNGIFYIADDYPDSHLFADGEYLRQQYNPDFLLFHSMGIDNAGHRYGGGSKEQAGYAMGADYALSSLLPKWLKQGYEVLVTADHSVGRNGHHGGNTPEQRIVPLYLFSERVRLEKDPNTTLSQLLIAPLLCRLLEIEPSKDMVAL